MNDKDKSLVEAVRSALSVDPRAQEIGYTEQLREPLLSLRVQLGRELVEARERVRMPNYKPDPKDKDTPRYTDFDRKIMLDAAVAELEAEFELVKGLEELVKERIEVIVWLGN